MVFVDEKFENKNFGFEIYSIAALNWHVDTDLSYVIDDDFIKFMSLKKWIEESCTGIVGIFFASDTRFDESSIHFELEEDAMLYKLTWL